MISWKMFLLTGECFADVGFSILAIRRFKSYNFACSVSVLSGCYLVYLIFVSYPLSFNAVSYNGFAFSCSSSLQDKSGNLLFLIDLVLVSLDFATVITRNHYQ